MTSSTLTASFIIVSLISLMTCSVAAEPIEYHISPSSCAELKSTIESDCSGYYYLEKDIDCRGETITPICSVFTPPEEIGGAGAIGGFYGNLIGQGHVIRGLTVVGIDNVGLFSSIIGGSGGVVDNLGLEGFTVNGDNVVGALAGSSTNGDIMNCYADAHVHCHGSDCGGLFGVASGQIGDCYTTGTVEVSPSVATYHISRLTDGWEQAYEKRFQTEYTTEAFDFRDIEGELTLRIIQKDLEFADIDEIRLEACGEVIGPRYAVYSSGESVLNRILQTDYSVVDAHDKEIEIAWDVPCGEATMYLTANEYSSSAGVPFRYPETGYSHYKTGNPKLYTAYWQPSSGHPPGTTYITVSDNFENVYFHLDITSDNTDELGKDWVRLTVNGKQFTVRDYENSWGSCWFGMTGKADYPHQTCQFVIPKSELQTEDLYFSISYYGTSVGYAHYIGGLVGHANSVGIFNSYSTSDIIAHVSVDYVGGLVGYADAGAIYSSYAVGEMTTDGGGTCLGGFVGSLSPSVPPIMVNNWWSNDVEDCGCAIPEGAQCTREPDKTAFYDVQETHPVYSGGFGWDFITEWDTSYDDRCYPPLQWEESCTDDDGDGYAAEGGCCGDKDCDDGRASANPAAEEDCDNGRDDDCDGWKDCGDPECKNHASCDKGGGLSGGYYYFGDTGTTIAPPSGGESPPPPPPANPPSITGPSSGKVEENIALTIRDGDGSPADGEATVTAPDGSQFTVPVVGGEAAFTPDLPGIWTISYTDPDGNEATKEINVAAAPAPPAPPEPESEPIVEPGPLPPPEPPADMTWLYLLLGIAGVIAALGILKIKGVL